MKLSIGEIEKALSVKANITSDIIIDTVVTDSRKADENTLFVALKGENFDGHDFIDAVYENGCRAVVIHRDVPLKEGMIVFKTEDTMLSLSHLAKFVIDKSKVRRIAVTGSVGKTTTKEMLGAVAEEISPTLKTIGNFNNNIGVPLTAFRLKDEKIGIFEMGMNHFGEIEYLSEIVRPHISVITNIGYSHIENLGSREGILKAKLEILKYMPEDGVIILNGDDEFLYGAKDTINITKIYVGINNENCDLKAKDIKEYADRTVFKVKGKEFELNVPGIHNVYNALVSIAAGRLLGGTYDQIKEGLKNFKPDGIRQNIIRHNGYTVIADCYNAAPDSMIASLNVLSKTEGKRKIAVFGSVAELGSVRDELLYEVGRQTALLKIDELITVTEDALSINEGAQKEGLLNNTNLASNIEVISYLKSNIKDGDVILIKGSRKYKMEEISESLAE